MKTDNKLSYAPYQEALDGVETQFALIRFALRELPKSKLENFFKNRAAESLARLEKGWQLAISLMPDSAESLKSARESSKEYAEKEARRNSRKKDARFKLEMSDDRINQSELLLLVAYFESFMKSVHWKFLEAASGIVFSKHDTKVLLSEVIDTEQGGMISRKFQEELFHKEVKKLDAQKINVKADYFEKYFGILFGDKKQIAELGEIMDLRNKISHEVYSEPATTIEEIKDQLLVSDEKLTQARMYFLQIPRKCVEAGEQSYRSHFKLY